VKATDKRRHRPRIGLPAAPASRLSLSLSHSHAQATLPAHRPYRGLTS